MGLELVHDADSNVEYFPNGNLMDIAGMARRFADYVEAGDWGEVNRVVVVIEHDGALAILPWGESTTAYELMGLFEAAKLRVFADDAIQED